MKKTISTVAVGFVSQAFRSYISNSSALFRVGVLAYI